MHQRDTCHSCLDFTTYPSTTSADNSVILWSVSSRLRVLPLISSELVRRPSPHFQIRCFLSHLHTHHEKALANISDSWTSSAELADTMPGCSPSSHSRDLLGLRVLSSSQRTHEGGCSYPLLLPESPCKMTDFEYCMSVSHRDTAGRELAEMMYMSLITMLVGSASSPSWVCYSLDPITDCY